MRSFCPPVLVFGCLAGADCVCHVRIPFKKVGAQVRSFELGVDQTRSRGGKEEPFGGTGASWKGCFVGGKYLVETVTTGAPGGRLHGVFPGYSLIAEVRRI